MDYDLGKGPNGSEGIEMVRDSFPFKDIVFYSAHGVQKLRQSLSENKFQGIFYSSRQDLPGSVVGVFQVLVKKVLDIEHSRGVVMGATSEIDHLINEAIATSFAQAKDELKAAALSLVARQLKENRKALEKEAEKLEALTDLATIGDFHQVFTSAHRLRLLRKMLEAAGTHAAERETMLEYATSTMLTAKSTKNTEKMIFSRKEAQKAHGYLTGGNEVSGGFIEAGREHGASLRERRYLTWSV